MTILVAGRKVGIKEDGTFASKVKLAIGRNDVLVQAEDINGNVSEKTVTFIREEFIAMNSSLINVTVFSETLPFMSSA